MKAIANCPICKFRVEWDFTSRYIKCPNISCGASLLVEDLYLAISKIEGSGLQAKAYLVD